MALGAREVGRKLLGIDDGSAEFTNGDAGSVIRHADRLA
jgi:hypothetical protein